MSTLPTTNTVLVAELRLLIEGARQRAAVAVNAELTLLYWRIGDRIHREILGSQRADYGEEIVTTLSRELTADFGRGLGCAPPAPLHPIRPNLPRSRDCAHAVCRIELVASAANRRH